MGMTTEELAARMRAARKAAGLTQEAVADALGLSRPAVSQMESGRRAVSGLELERLARLCGRGLGDFFRDSFTTEGNATVALFRRHPEFSSDSDLREALGEALAFGRSLSDLEDLLQIDRGETVAASYRSSGLQGKWVAIQQGERTAEAERRRLGLGIEPLPEMLDLMESQGVHAVALRLPEQISGLTVVDAAAGVVVAVNGRHGFHRQRFSLAHEYAHVLLDCDRQACVSRRTHQDSLIEVRANSFAAAFLLPAAGVQRFVEHLAKGRAGRIRRQVSDGRHVQTAERRSPPGSQQMRLHDLVMLAHRFGVSRPAALYRLKSLRLITERERSALAEQHATHGKRVARLLGLATPSGQSRCVPRKRLVALGIEALQQDLISYGKLRELARQVDVPEDDLEEIVVRSGIDLWPPVDVAPVDWAALEGTESCRE